MTRAFGSGWSGCSHARRRLSAALLWSGAWLLAPAMASAWAAPSATSSTSSGSALGVSSRPYAGMPAYLALPVSEHTPPPREQLERVGDLLGAIDAHAGALDQRDVQAEQPALRGVVDELAVVLPPRSDLLIALDQMRAVVEELPRLPAEEARRRLWALTDVIRLRAEQ